MILAMATVNSAFGQSCQPAGMRYLAEGNGRPNPGTKCDDPVINTWYLKSTSGIATWKSTAENLVSSYDCFVSKTTETGHDDGTIVTVNPKLIETGAADLSSYTEDDFHPPGIRHAFSATTYGAGHYVSYNTVYTGWFNNEYTKNTTDGTWSLEASGYYESSGSYDVFYENSAPTFGYGGSVPYYWTDVIINPNTCKNTLTTGSYLESTPSGPPCGLLPYKTYLSEAMTTQSKLETVYGANAFRSDVMAVIPPYPDLDLMDWPKGLAQKAFYQRADDLSWMRCGRMKYFLEIPDSDKDTIYEIKWTEVQTFYDTSKPPFQTNRTDTITGTGDPVIPARGKIFEVDVPTIPSEIVEIGPIETSIRPKDVPAPPPGNRN